MPLTLFLIDLLQTGQVTVPRTLSEFNQDTLAPSSILLKEYYEADALHMPAEAPAYNPDAALWAAKFIFNTIQFILARDLTQAQLEQTLTDYDGEQTASAIYSADLVLRFLPDLFKFANSLSPEDPLINKLRNIASKWTYSSVGVDNLSTINPSDIVLKHPSLSIAYIDRIIKKGDINRLTGTEERSKLKEVLGIHQQQLWPSLDKQLTDWPNELMN